MLELSKKHFRLDFLFLRKDIYYIRNNNQFLEIDFQEPYCGAKLKDFWLNLILANPDAISNRLFEWIFRTAKAFARLMFKTTVDSEVIDQTIKFIGGMHETHGTQIAPLDTQIYRLIVKGLTTKEISVELKIPFTNNSDPYPSLTNYSQHANYSIVVY